ncbi:MAG: DUF4136 domain-containing protein [Chitinophagales bacterium]
MKKNYLILIALEFAIMGCFTGSNINYQAEKTKGVDFKKYKTYAWLATKDTAYMKLVDKKTLEKVLATNVIEQLSKRGMVLDTLNPDCLFTYTLVMNKTYQVGQQPQDVVNLQAYAPTYPGQNNIYYYQPYYGVPSYNGGMAVTTFRDGSLVIDMIDRRDNKVVWRSSAQGKTEEENRKGVKATLKEAIPEMFKKFPVKQK